GVRERRHQARLVEEHRDELGVVGVALEDALDDHGPLDALEPALAREVDLGHPPSGDPARDPIGAEVLQVSHPADHPPARAQRARAQRALLSGLAKDTIAEAPTTAAPGTRPPTAGAPKLSCNFASLDVRTAPL